MGNRCASPEFGVYSNSDTAPATVNKNVWLLYHCVIFGMGR